MTQKPVKTTSLGQLVRNSIYNSGSWGINLAIVFLTTPYLVFKLTPEIYGTYVLLTGLIGYYTLMDLGLGTAVTKYVAQYKVTENYKAMNYSINGSIVVMLSAGFVASLVLVLFTSPILKLLNIAPEYWQQARLGLYLAAVGFPLQILSNTLSSAVKGLQRYDLSNTVYVILEATKNVAMVVAAFLGFGLVALMAIALITSLVAVLANFVIIKKQMPTWRIRDGLDKATFRQLFTYSSSVVVSTMSVTFFRDYVARFVISYFFGPAYVTYYVVPLGLIRAFQGLFNRAQLVIFPYASELGATKDTERLKRVWLTGSKLSLATAFPIFLSLLIFAKPIMSLWMGAEFAEKTWSSLSLLAFGALLSSMTVISIHIAMGLGYARVRSYFSAVTIGLFLVLLAPATARYGVNGAIIASIICVSIPSLTFVGYVARNIMKHSLPDFLMKTLSFHVIPFFVASLITVTLSYKLTPQPWVFVLLAFTVVGYFALMALTNWLPMQFLARVRRTVTPQK
jgi:O-antigen/teichoic acid export membrane protein